MTETIHHLVIVGVPDRFYKDVEAKLGSFLKQRRTVRLIGLGLKSEGGQLYSNSNYVIGLKSKLANAVQAKTTSHAALVTFVDADASSELVKKEFLPYCMLAPLNPLHPDLLSFNRHREAVNVFVEAIEDSYKSFEKPLAIIRQEVTDRRNKTPLLLPPKNFQSESLGALLERTALSPALAADAAAFVQAYIEEFVRAHPRQVIPDETRKPHTAFESHKGLFFVSPGKDLHGEAHEGHDGHNNDCRLGARLRCGHSFHPAFHYDVKSAQRMPKEMPTCHGPEFKVPKGAGHVNVSPNDFARKSG